MKHSGSLSKNIATFLGVTKKIAALGFSQEQAIIVPVMNRLTGLFSKTTQSLFSNHKFMSLVAAPVIMAAALLPSSAKAQSTVDTINWNGVINQVLNVPGVTDGMSVQGSIGFNLANAVLVDGTGLTEASGYTDTGNVTINGIQSPENFIIDVFHNVPDINGIYSSGFGITWGPGYNDGIVNYFPVSAAPDTTIASFQTMLGINPADGLSGDNQFGVYWNATATSGAEGLYSSFDLVTPTPEPTISSSGTNLALSWTTNTAQNYQLVQSSSLLGTNWSKVTNAPVVTNGQYRVSLSPTNKCEFFRLQGTN